MLILSQGAQLPHAAGMKLAHPFLGNPKAAADFRQRQSTGHVALEAGAEADDRSFAWIELFEQPVHTLGGACLLREQV